MLIDKENIYKAFQQIKDHALLDHPAMSVLVFVALEADALCASRIITQLLREDFVTYEVVPVVGYNDITTAVRDVLVEQDNIRSIIMVNCGGTLDLVDFFNDEETGLDIRNTNLNIYVFDSHRPLHLANVHDQEMIHLFADGSEPPPPSKEEYDIAQNEVDLDDSDSDNKSDNEDDEGGSPSKRRKIETEQLDKRQTRAERMAERQAIQQKLTRYYGSGTSYGMSSALMMYDLVVALAKSNNDLLWPAILGLTDQFLHEKIDRDTYTQHVIDLKAQVARINKGEGEEGVTESEANLKEEGNTITFQEEFRFMIMRHWSLYESMFYSTYVATRLKIWTERGQEKLNVLLTRMGLPLSQCREKYSIMDVNLKKKLRDKLTAHASECGLDIDDLLYGTFCRKYPFQTPMAASDVISALTALMERPASQSLDGIADALRRIQDTPDEDKDFEGKHDVRVGMRTNFFVAWDALSGKNSTVFLQKGLELAMEQQRAIVSQAKAMIEQKAVTMAKGFRHCRTCGDYAVFGSPLILTRLAQFLFEIYKERKTGPTPFVVASQVDKSNMYLVVGITGSRYGQVTKNPFGHAFRLAAEKIHVEFRHDSFSTNVIEIHTNDYMHFLHSLSYLFR